MEIKCVKEISFSNHLQLITYACMVNEYINWKVQILSEIVDNYIDIKKILKKYEIAAKLKNGGNPNKMPIDINSQGDTMYTCFVKCMQASPDISFLEVKSYKEYEESYFEKIKFRLFNILDNEITEFIFTKKNADRIFTLLKNYNENVSNVSDQQFIENCYMARQVFLKKIES